MTFNSIYRFACVALLISLSVSIAGCSSGDNEGVKDDLVVTTKTSVNNISSLQSSKATTTTKFVFMSTTTTVSEASFEGWVLAPELGCQCVKWSCPVKSVVESSISLTTTTCIEVPDPDYIPRERYFKMIIKGSRFRPDLVRAMVGDLVIVNITNEQGLHKIRETYSNKTILLQPGDSHELFFNAQKEGRYLLTCNPFCEDPLEAEITVTQPYKEIC